MVKKRLETEWALKAGAGQSDITPAMGTQIAGDIGRYRPAEWVMDPLYAKALVLESGEVRVCVISADLLAVNTPRADEVRNLVAERLGIAPGAVMFHVTQNHAAPALGHFMISELSPEIPADLPWLRGGDERYDRFAVERILEAVDRAQGSLKPVRVASARGIEGRVAFNRRFMMRHGRAATHPRSGDPAICYAEGPIDPEVGLMCLITEALEMPAMILHYTCHPGHGYPERYISAGWPGAWASSMKASLGGCAVPMVLNGCCGNIHHNNHLDPSHVDNHENMGKILAKTALSALKRLEYERTPTLACRSRHISIPLRPVLPEEIAKAESLLAKAPEPMWLNDERTAVDWDWFFAVATLDLHRTHQARGSEFAYEIQALRIGDIALVALGGEPFVEAGLEIKLKSPAKRTYLAHMCNGYVGYIPTRQAFEHGGYETGIYTSRLVPEALERITASTLELLEELWG